MQMIKKAETLVGANTDTLKIIIKYMESTQINL